MINTKLVLRLDKKRGDGKAPLYLRLTKSRKSAYINTGLKVMPSMWDDNKQKLKSIYPNATAANASLRALVYKAESYAHSYDTQGKPYSTATIKTLLKHGDETNLLSTATRWIEDRYARELITYTTKIKHTGVFKKLKTYTRGVLTLGDLTYEFIQSYDSYLRHELGNHPNTVASNMSCIRSFCNFLIRDGTMKVEGYPFRRYRFRFEDSLRGYLSHDDIDRFAAVELCEGTKIKASQDIFLFCTQTGLRIGDALHLKVSDFEGRRITFFRQKGKKYDSLLLTPLAYDVISRYIDDSRGKDDFIFPFLSLDKQFSDKAALNDQKSATSLINKNLKIIARRAGMEEMPSTHIARHSLATNGLLDGLTLEELKGILDHRSVKTTEIYARVVDQMKDRAILKLVNSGNKS